MRKVQNRSLSFLKSLLILTASLACLISCVPKAAYEAKIENLPPLQTGDLVFLDLDCGALCDAIESVTLEQFKVSGPRLSHIGVVEKINEDIFVLEAWPRGGVQTVSLETFLSRVRAGRNEEGGYYLGRLRPEYRSIGEAAVARIQTMLDRPYDDEFNWETDRFYCSELISFGFSQAGRPLLNKSQSLFSPVPMYFGKNDSPTHSTWEEYYRDLGKDIPAREPGLSPLGIYLEGKRRLFISEK